MSELARERRALASMIQELGATPVLFEELGGRDEGAQEAFRAGVARSDSYLGIVAVRYGAVAPDGAGLRPTRSTGRPCGSTSGSRPGPTTAAATGRGMRGSSSTRRACSAPPGPPPTPRTWCVGCGRGWARSPSRTMRPGSSTARWFRVNRISDRGGRVRVEATGCDPAVAEALAAGGGQRHLEDAEPA